MITKKEAKAWLKLYKIVENLSDPELLEWWAGMKGHDPLDIYHKMITYDELSLVLARELEKRSLVPIAIDEPIKEPIKRLIVLDSKGDTSIFVDPITNKCYQPKEDFEVLGSNLEDLFFEVGVIEKAPLDLLGFEKSMENLRKVMSKSFLDKQ